MVGCPWQVGLEHIMNKSVEVSQQQHWFVVSTLLCASRFLPFVPVLASLNEINLKWSWYYHSTNNQNRTLGMNSLIKVKKDRIFHFCFYIFRGVCCCHFKYT